MALNPNRLSFQRQKLYIPVTQFSGLLPGFTVTKGAILASSELGLSADSASATVNNNTIAATLTLPNIITSRSALGTFATAAELGEVSTSGLVGLKMNTAGQTVSHLMYQPNDWERSKPVYIRVVWTSGSATTADTIDWIVTYVPITLNASTSIAASTVALDTAIAQDTVTGAFHCQQTEAGVINNLGTLSDDKLFKFTVEMDAFAAGLTEDKYLLGVEFEYTPRFGKGLNSPAGKAATFGQIS